MKGEKKDLEAEESGITGIHLEEKGKVAEERQMRLLEGASLIQYKANDFVMPLQAQRVL